MSSLRKFKSVYNVPNEPDLSSIHREADRIYQKLENSLNRDSNYTKKLIFCIFNAYLNLNKVCDIRVVTYYVNQSFTPKTRVKNTNSKISSIFKIFSELRTGYRFKVLRFSFLDYTKYYLRHLTKLNASTKTDIVKLTELIEAKCQLNSSKPQSIAAAIILYYVSRCEVNLEAYQQLEAILYRAMNTIKELILSVGAWHNQAIAN